MASGIMGQLLNRSIFVLLLFIATIVVSDQPKKFRPASSEGNNVNWNGLFHDTFDLFYRDPFGAVPTGASVDLKFRTFRNDATAVYMRVYAYDPPTDTNARPIRTPMAPVHTASPSPPSAIPHHTPH